MSGYVTLGEPTTAAQLIAILQEFPPDAHVEVLIDNGDDHDPSDCTIQNVKQGWVVGAGGRLVMVVEIVCTEDDG